MKPSRHSQGSAANQSTNCFLYRRQPDDESNRKKSATGRKLSSKKFGSYIHRCMARFTRPVHEIVKRISPISWPAHQIACFKSKLHNLQSGNEFPSFGAAKIAITANGYLSRNRSSSSVASFDLATFYGQVLSLPGHL